MCHGNTVDNCILPVCMWTVLFCLSCKIMSSHVMLTVSHAMAAIQVHDYMCPIKRTKHITINCKTH